MASLGDALAADGLFNPEWAADGHAPADLLLAADEHRSLMVPAERDFVAKTLGGLRSATIVRDEDPDEAKASFNLLRVHLSDVPADILAEACRRYVNQPGRRFFPRSAGELRAFINPLVLSRQVREHRLRCMAAAAAERDRRAEAQAAFEWTVERLRDLPRFAAAAVLRAGGITQAMFDEVFPPGAEEATASDGP